MNSFESANINIGSKSVDENFRAVKTCLDNLVDDLNSASVQDDSRINEIRKSVSTLSDKVDAYYVALNARIARLEQK